MWLKEKKIVPILWPESLSIILKLYLNRENNIWVWDIIIHSLISLTDLQTKCDRAVKCKEKRKNSGSQNLRFIPSTKRVDNIYKVINVPNAFTCIISFSYRILQSRHFFHLYIWEKSQHWELNFFHKIANTCAVEP